MGFRDRVAKLLNKVVSQERLVFTWSEKKIEMAILDSSGRNIAYGPWDVTALVTTAFADFCLEEFHSGETSVWKFENDMLGLKAGLVVEPLDLLIAEQSDKKLH